MKFAHDMPRRYGYASIGQRCSGEMDWGADALTGWSITYIDAFGR